VSATTVYLSAGRAAGITPGDSVVISRGEAELARIIVSFVSENSSSCEMKNLAGIIARDDVALVFASGAETSAAPVPAEVETVMPVQATDAQQTELFTIGHANELTGRIGVEYTIQDDQGAVNYDYTEPAMSLRASLRRIGGSDFSARTNLRLRRTMRASDDRSASTNRIYEALIAYEPKDKPIQAGAGRVLRRETRGMGYLDGAYVKYDLNHSFALGAVGGLEPDLQNTRIQTDVTKVGAFVAYKQKLSNSQSLQTTASLAGRYLKGEVSREFIYQQLSFVSGGKLRLFESTEINLNRGWLKDAEGSSITLASVLLDARYSFARELSVSLGYDNRTNYYTAETRTIPDSLFDSAQRQGFRASLDSRFGKSYTAEAGIGLRDRDGNKAQATSGWLRLGTTSLGASAISIFARFRWFDSQYSTGTQPSLFVSREAATWLRVGVEGGTNDYELNTTSTTVSQQWLAVMFDFDLARRTYASLELEQGFGDGRDVTLMNVALGYRF